MEGKIKLLIADDTYKVTDSLRDIFDKEGNIEIVGIVREEKEIFGAIEKYHPDLLLLDVEITDLDSMHVIKEIVEKKPEILIIVVFTEKTKNYIKQCMALGAREYVVKPFSTHALMDTIKNLYEIDISRRKILSKRHAFMEEIQGNKNVFEKRHKLITFFSTKGGVGKSVMAANLAVALAEMNNGKVVLVDLDLMSGDLSVILDLYPQRTMSELMKEIQILDRDVIEDYLIKHKSGLKILPAPISPEYSEYITAESVEEIIKVLLESYEYVVVDTGPSFRDINLISLDVADRVLFFTTLDLPTIKNVRIGLDIMKKLNYEEEKISLVLNKYNKRYGVTIKELEKTVKKKIENIIPMDDSTVISSVNRGEPFVTAFMKKPVSKAVIELAKEIMKK